MRTVLVVMVGLAAFIGIGLSTSCSSSDALAGPLGGDVVLLEDEKVRAEVLANSETGEILVRTWDENADEPRAIPARSLVVGEGARRVELQPFPLETDPRGLCSRFFGQADWVRNHELDAGWLARGDAGESARHEFACRRCWDAGRKHAGSWRPMAEHWEGMRHGRAMGGSR